MPHRVVGSCRRYQGGLDVAARVVGEKEADLVLGEAQEAGHWVEGPDRSRDQLVVAQHQDPCEDEG